MISSCLRCTAINGTSSIWTIIAIELHPTNKKCGVYAPVEAFGAAREWEELATNLGENTVTRRLPRSPRMQLYYHDTDADSDSTLFEPATW
jgi:hypothetical protein